MLSLHHLCFPIYQNPTHCLKPSKPLSILPPKYVSKWTISVQSSVSTWCRSPPAGPPQCLLIAVSAPWPSNGLFSQQQPEQSIGNINHVTLQIRRLPAPLRTAPTFSLLMPARSCLICPLPPCLLAPTTCPSLFCSHLSTLLLCGCPGSFSPWGFCTAVPSVRTLFPQIFTWLTSPLYLGPYTNATFS